MKKKFLLAGLGLTVAMAASLCACNSGSASGALSKPNDIYGMGAVSTVKLLGGDTSAQALRKLSAVSSVAATDDGVKAQAQRFNEYFTALDSFMGEDIVSTVSEENTDTKYPYKTKLTINSRDFDGNPVQNVMYFTETFLTTNTDIDDDDDDKETESIYTLEGVLVVDGADYRLEGERTYEQEGNETENELKIRAYADINDRRSFVEMEQEYSEEGKETETEYVYSIYSNGALVEQTAVEFEKERKGGKEETEYELEFRKGAARGKYVVEREAKNGKVTIRVRYNIDGKQGSFRISEITGANGEKQYEYTFEDNSKLVF